MRRVLTLSRFWPAVVIFGFVLVPFLIDKRSTLILLTQIFILAVFAMSYDLLLGYTGIVSFGHAMFFGMGSYTLAIVMDRLGPSIPMVLFAFGITAILTAIVSYIVGIISLRLKSHFYAMLTLAFSGLFLVGAEKWRSLTRGSDGFTFMIPDVLKDREVFYFTALLFLIIMYFIMNRFTLSPVGRVLQAVRENEQRVESLGYGILYYKVTASIVSGVIAGWCGAMYAINLRFVNTAVFSIETTLDALLMTIIGGVGTLVGGLIGAGLIEMAQDGLKGLAKVHWIFERWIIFFGIFYILIVMYFPKGIVGTLKPWISGWMNKRDHSSYHTLDGKGETSEDSIEIHRTS